VWCGSASEHVPTGVPDDTPIERLRPAALPAERVVARLGLIADTHMPDRCLAFPPALFDVFRGVDLILHAGDVGLLSTLDQLSRVAPVVAVHGNDERDEEAPRELPYQQVVAVAGRRIVLTHAHYPDLAQEFAARRDDRWQPKLARRAAFGHRAGAKIVVYGHTHVPTNVEYEGVWLINPGGVASGGLDTRMRYATVALLYLRDDGVPFAVHVDLAQPDRPFAPWSDWGAGFKAARERFEASILAPDLAADFPRLRAAVMGLDDAAATAARLAVREAALRCWTGEVETITREDLRATLARATDIPTMVREQLLPLLGARSEGGAEFAERCSQRA
jgi:putative phosphoesterase